MASKKPQHPKFRFLCLLFGPCSHAEGVRLRTAQTSAVHPALAPLSCVDLCLFYLKCVVCMACDLRDNRPYPGDSRETDPSFASENANAVFLEAIKHSDAHGNTREKSRLREMTINHISRATVINGMQLGRYL